MSNPGVIYALSSLAFTAVNDLVFKLFACRMRSIGVFVALVGLVGLLSMLPFTDITAGNMQATLIWGSLGGLMSVAANILLLESMARQSAGVCSTIYRLNMVFVVIGAFFLLGESISARQLLGIVLALAAVISFVPFRDFSSKGNVSRSGFLLALCACLLRACMGIAYKFGFRHGADSNGIAMLTDIAWIAGGFVYMLLKRDSWRELASPNILGYSLLSGVLVAGAIFCMARSLDAGDASLVLPLAQMSFLPTFLLSVLFLHEKVTPGKIAAVCCGCAAIFFLASGT